MFTIRIVGIVSNHTEKIREKNEAPIICSKYNIKLENVGN